MFPPLRAGRLPASALLAAVLAALSGCGQKGPLFMPPPEAQAPAAEQGEDGEQDADAAATGG